jgi:hypothetical protein
MEENNETTDSLAPFTLEDAKEDEKACLLCVHRPTCPIIIYVNKLSIKRNGKVADDEFNCCFFKDEEQKEEVEVV